MSLDAYLTTHLKDLILTISLGIEIIAALIIAYGTIEAFVKTAILFVHPSAPAGVREGIRLRLGRWLSLALEFELASDILSTAVAPTLQELEVLGAVVAIRTVLNFFLQRDISQAQEAGQPQQ